MCNSRYAKFLNILTRPCTSVYSIRRLKIINRSNNNNKTHRKVLKRDHALLNFSPIWVALLKGKIKTFLSAGSFNSVINVQA